MAWRADRGLTDEAAYQAARLDEWRWRQARQWGLSRRGLLAGLLAGAVTRLGGERPSGLRAQTTGGALLVKPTPPEQFIDHGLEQEMRWEQMAGQGMLVPAARFYVRNHGATPHLEAATWRLRVEGPGVERPLTLTYDALLALPSVTRVQALECAGNGRRFFLEAYGTPAPGSQWQLGGIGVAEWTGVPLREVLERAGLKRSARDLLPAGGMRRRGGGRCRSAKPWPKTPCWPTP